MIPKPDEADYKKRLAYILAHPDLMEEVCAHVANGGTAQTLVEAWDIRYSDLMRAIRTNKDWDQRYIHALNDRAEWGKEMFLSQLRAFARLDISRAFNEDGSLKPVTEIPADIMQAVEGIEVDELWEGAGKDREQVGVTKKLKFLPKLKAIELAMKNAGLLIERHVVKEVKSMEELLAESNKPEEKTDEPPAAS